MFAYISLTSAPLWTLLSVSFLVSASDDITAEPGQTVILPCRAPSENVVIILEWTRPDQDTEYVLVYRDGRPETENQDPSFKDRVELNDKQMKSGDVSLILKNVTKDDNGKYECHVIQRETNRRKRSSFETEPIKIITLTVKPGHTEEGGDKEGGDKDERVGLAVGLSVVAVLLVVSVVFAGVVVTLRKRRFSKQKTNQHPAGEAVELQLI